MMRMIEALSVLMLTGCKEETAQDTTALPLTAQAVGHFCKLNFLEHEGQKGQAHLSGLPAYPSSSVKSAMISAMLLCPNKVMKFLCFG
jgi:copper chaperone NosL